MTARDLATLSIRLIRDFPEHYKVYAERSFAHNGITQGNRNPLLYKDLGVDGIKTGHTQEAGYGLAASAKRGERRLVLVVTGLKSMNERSRETERLLEWGFREFNNYALFKAGEKVADADVWLGVGPKVPLLIGDNVTLTLPRGARKDMKVKYSYRGPIAAPIAKGQPTLLTISPRPPAAGIPLVAGESVEGLGLADASRPRCHPVGRVGLRRERTRRDAQVHHLEGGEGAGKSTQVSAWPNACAPRPSIPFSPASRAVAPAPRTFAPFSFRASRRWSRDRGLAELRCPARDSTDILPSWCGVLRS